MSARIETDPRIRRRRRSVERGRRRRALTVLGAVTLTGLVAWIAFFSPLLQVRHVRMVGARHTTSADVIAAADISSEDNLLLLSVDSVERDAETLPWVKSAEVDRKLPDTLRVRVVERTPAAVVGIGAARWTIDARGHVLSAGSVGADLPVLSGVELGEIRAGIKLEQPEVVGALRAFRSLPARLKESVAAFFAPTPERISFSLRNGIVIRYGSAERLQAKRRVLIAILARLARSDRTAAYIDIRVPTNPAVAPTVPPPIVVAPPPAEPDEDQERTSEKGSQDDSP